MAKRIERQDIMMKPKDNRIAIREACVAGVCSYHPVVDGRRYRPILCYMNEDQVVRRLKEKGFRIVQGKEARKLLKELGITK
jgi:hypothetical protein